MTALGIIRAVRLARVAPKFDAHSRPFYVLLGAIVLLALGMLKFTGIDVSRALQFGIALWACGAVLGAAMLRRVGDVRLATGIETIAATIVMALALIAMQFPLAVFSRPFADGALLNADRALGFDWLAFANLFRDHRALMLLHWAYLSLATQSVFVPAFLAWRGATARAWRFTTATIILFAASVAIFPLFPADGRFVLCGLRPAAIPVFDRFCAYGPILHQLKAGSLSVIQPSMVVGMVTFPSAHAAAGAVLTWAIWPNRWLRWPSALLNGALCVGAVVIGSHYLVDIVGGLALAAASIYCAKRLVGEEGTAQ